MLDFHDSDDEPSGESFVIEYENNEHTMNEWKSIYCLFRN